MVVSIGEPRLTVSAAGDDSAQETGMLSGCSPLDLFWRKDRQKEMLPTPYTKSINLRGATARVPRGRGRRIGDKIEGCIVFRVYIATHEFYSGERNSVLHRHTRFRMEDGLRIHQVVVDDDGPIRVAGRPPVLTPTEHPRRRYLLGGTFISMSCVSSKTQPCHEDSDQEDAASGDLEAPLSAHHTSSG